MSARTRRKSRLGHLIDDPVVNGIVTLIVAFIAVYVSYTANNGIPGIPKYHVTIDVPDAGQLVRHAEVRVGGARVGQVLEIKPVAATATEPAHARLKLALNKDLEPLAADTKSEVRVASILGGKYIGLTPGHAAQKLRGGEILPLKNAQSAVDLDESFRVFTPATQMAVRKTVTELGNAFAARGVSLNNALGQLARATPSLQRVLTLLAAPKTNLAGFLSATAATVTTLEPLTDAFVQTLADGATTLRAVNAAGDALGRTIAVLPGAEAQTTTTLVHLRPALAAAADISRDLRPAASIAPRTLTHLDQTLVAATPVAKDIRTLASPLTGAFKAVGAFATNRQAIDALKLLGSTDLATFGASGFVGLGGIFAALAPAQLSCNILGIYARNISSTLSEGDQQGSWLPLVPLLSYATSPIAQHTAAPDPQLHINAYPNENADECEAGNEPYAAGQAVGNPAGNQSRTVDQTSPPAAATARARAAGLLRSAPR